MKSCPVDQVEQDQGHQRKYQYKEIRVEVPHVRHDHAAIIGELGYGWEYLLISQAVNNCADKKAQETRNDIVELAFAATGGASAWSVPGKRHPYAKYQSPDDITDDISGRYGREGDQP